MKEISLHILDIVQNSIAAKAEQVEIIVAEKIKKNLLKIEIKDDGTGMDKKEQKEVLDPFVTSRTTREVGLGLPFLKRAAENCNGELILDSQKGEGTSLKVIFEYDHIDRAPLGDIIGTIVSLIITNPQLDFIYKHIYNNKEFELNTTEIKKEIGDIKINHPEIVNWINNYIEDNLNELRQ
ncbi:MAG TPA: ATP-binding protein [Halanaerobiales bacterium]|nr:ATP-binding protein [Halanaerobiales bacterium]